MDFVNPFFVSIHIAPNTVAFVTFRIITFILFGSMNLFGMFFELFFRSCFVATNVTGNVFLAFVTNKVSIFIFGNMFFGLMHIKSNLRIETIGTAIGSMTVLEMITEEEVKNDFHVYLQLSPMQSS